MSGWPQVAFAEVVDFRGSGALALPQSEWVTVGKYPVIGQGSEPIEGWTNRGDLVIEPDPAVVLYGGHTRRAKFVNMPFVPGPNVKILEPANGLDAKFLYHFLVQLRVESRGYADHFPEVRRCGVPVPPLSEQRRVAAILDLADALRAKRRQTLALLDGLVQSIFVETFGSPIGNPKGWMLKLLTEICSPKQWPTITTAQLVQTGFPVFGANGPIGFFSEYNHEEATVLITCRGATCGTVNVSPPKCYVTGNSMALDDPDASIVTLSYLEEALRLRGFEDVISGTAQPQITRQGLSSVKVALPPLKMQLEFASKVETIRKARLAYAASLAELDVLFASVQHRAFAGLL